MHQVKELIGYLPIDLLVDAHKKGAEICPAQPFTEGSHHSRLVDCITLNCDDLTSRALILIHDFLDGRLFEYLISHQSHVKLAMPNELHLVRGQALGQAVELLGLISLLLLSLVSYEVWKAGADLTCPLDEFSFQFVNFCYFLLALRESCEYFTVLIPVWLA